MRTISTSSRRLLALAVAGTLAGLSGASHAAGFSLPEVSAAGVGMANALVANKSELGALPYNPAAMAFHDGSNLSVGMTVFDPNLNVKTASGTTQSNTSPEYYLPNVYFMGHADDAWTFGLGVNAPFGLETNWPVNTFPGFGSGALQGYAPSQTLIRMFNINPNVAYRLGPNTSVAVGADNYQVTSAALSNQGSSVNGDGEDWGWNIAAMQTMGPWNFGLSYRSEVKVGIDGFLGSSAVNVGATSSIDFPGMLQVGAHYQATDQLGVEFDYNRTFWSSFDQTVVVPAAFIPAATSTNNWQDSNTYRLAATYNLRPTTQLQIGYAYDETPQPDAYFSARVPDANRQIIGLGIKQGVGSWDVQASAMYVYFNNRTINSATPYGGPGTDPNGTTAYNGEYKSSALVFGIGASTKF